MVYQLGNELYRAGCDFTGTPDETKGLYACCYVAIPVGKVEAISLSLAKLRVEAGMSQGEEFHGHKLPESINLRVMQAALDAQALVFAHFVDKTRSGSALPPSRQFTLQLLDLTFRSGLAAARTHRISIDEDIEGAAMQREARTRICRLNRSFWSDARTKVTFARSDKDEFVQLADVFAYCLQAYFCRRVKTEELSDTVAELSNSPRILKPMAWKGESVE